MSLMLNSNSDDSETLYSDSVFSTYLYTGNGSPQTINNGIDLAGKGGLVWVKGRIGTYDAYNHSLHDTQRGLVYRLSTNNTNTQSAEAGDLSSFNSNGFTLGGGALTNDPSTTYTSWTFRKAAKFFDVVTYTGGKAIGDTVPHNLGVASFIIITKRVDAIEDWAVNYVNQSGTYPWDHTGATLNSTAISRSPANGTSWATSTTFKPYLLANASNNANATNTSGGTYIAYLFAHDPSPGGIIRCGSYTGNGSATGPVVSLGWEPQYLMIKNATGTGSWQIIDNMRGMTVGTSDAALQANASTAETAVDYVSPTATGFQVTSTSSEVNTSTATYIYMAIRRPNKPPTSGTQVFDMSSAMTGSAKPAFNGSFPVDMAIQRRPAFAQDWHIASRLTGTNNLYTNTTDAEISQVENTWGYMDGWGKWNVDNSDYKSWNFKRAPGFFDVVCYTGNGTNSTNIPHNLTVNPELIIIKKRSAVADWAVWYKSFAAGFMMNLNGNYAMFGGQTEYFSTTQTSTTFGVNNGLYVNASAGTYVAYLFATLAGVSKVGSYTGNGSSQTINCGFAAGARFILIKRTDAAGDWYIWDTARGIVAATDPHLSLNTTAAEVTTDDSIDPDNTGFIVNQVAATNINVTSATYIFLAIS